MFTNEENQHGKKPHWVILRSPLSRIHYYHNKRLQVKESQYFIPTYNWTLTLIPNWTCSIVTISPFQYMLAIIYKAFWFFLLFVVLCIFSFKQIMHRHIRDRKEIPNDVKHLKFHFCYAEAYKGHFMIGRKRWWDGYLCFSLWIF